MYLVNPDIVYSQLVGQQKLIINKDSQSQYSIINHVNLPESIHVLVYVNFSGQKEEEVQTIHKMMAACKLMPNEYFIDEDATPWRAYKHLTNIKTVLVFGVEEKILDLNVKFSLHKTILFSDVEWIKSKSIKEIIQNPNIKAHLWKETLKVYFNV